MCNTRSIKRPRGCNSTYLVQALRNVCKILKSHCNLKSEISFKILTLLDTEGSVLSRAVARAIGLSNNTDITKMFVCVPVCVCEHACVHVCICMCTENHTPPFKVCLLWGL